MITFYTHTTIGERDVRDILPLLKLLTAWKNDTIILSRGVVEKVARISIGMIRSKDEV